ncbi:DAK2 domain-containing protein [Mycolicibacterium sp.]|uniref:DAK2 domain-containing protein n=1 Tax=Mycolicibacterium sp. TaxID=2320850 RepID=UPI0028A597D2|nr:DAK2 domain-containing protein [Mycolicibacterium sp.]
MPDRPLDASALRDWAHACVGDLIRHTDEINGLNVFPVADADTGTNMLFTLRAALAEADPVARSGDVAAVAAALARGALNGARGNSGVIVSQILRAVSDVTAEAARDRDIADLDAALLGAALRHAVVLVISAMGGEEVPGTVVSVLKAAAEAIGDRPALSQALAVAADAAAEALERTTEQLAVLAEAGVVDAGGRGLLVLLDALSSTIAGRAPVRRAYLPAAPAARHEVTEAPTPQFEVMYLVGECDDDGLKHLRTALDALGDSVALAAAAEDRHSVHVHTDDAGAAVEAGLAVGTVSRIRISALETGRVAPGGWSRQRAVLALVDGDDAEQLFRTEGACVQRPDAELVDPANGVSAEQLLRALVDTGAAQVMVLPNGYVAAEDLVAGCTAAIGWGIDVVPLPCRSMVQGLAALAVHDQTRQAVDDGYTMARAAAGARHGSVRIATEQALTWAGACLPGDGLGISGDEVVVVDPDPVAAAARLIDLLLGSGGELVTVLIGQGVGRSADAVADRLAAHVHRRHPGTEFTSYRTGHRGDLLLIGVE